MTAADAEEAQRVKEERKKQKEEKKAQKAKEVADGKVTEKSKDDGTKKKKKNKNKGASTMDLMTPE